MYDSCKRAPNAAELSSLLERLTAPSPAADDAERIDRIRQFEELKATLAAAQARETATFVDSQRAAQRSSGTPDDEVGRGIAAQVGLARHISPYHASRYVGWVKILTTELPHTYAAMCAGHLSEARALIVARETVWLSCEYRAAPDCMTRLSALLPVAQGVAALAALRQAADAARADGDERGRGQIMADTLVERVTGQETADAVPVNLNVIITDEALFNTGDHPDEPAHVVAAGVPATVIPAELARRAAANPDALVFLRRLFTSPDTGQLAAMDSRSRFFPANLRKFLLLRDRYCRTPWCGAPIRHADHVTPAADGGVTSAGDGQGLCAACNYAKEAAGWLQSVDGADVLTTTPTGHRYRSSPPRLPGWRPPSTPSPVEFFFRELLAA